MSTVSPDDGVIVEDSRLQCESLGYAVIEAYTGCLFWTVITFLSYTVIFAASIYQIP